MHVALSPKATKFSFAISLNYLLLPSSSAYGLQNSGEYSTPSGPLRCRILEESLREEENTGRKYMEVDWHHLQISG